MNGTFPKMVIDPIADALVNRNVVEEHPWLRPILTRPTTRCAFDGRPSVVVVTGVFGQRLGQCASCATAHETVAGETTAERAARIDQFAERMLDAIRDPETYWQQRGGDAPREHTDVNTVSVSFGPANGTSNGEPTEHWPTPDMEVQGYTFEAIYDPTRISLADAEARVRAELAGQGLQVRAFLNEGPITAAERGGPAWIARYGCPGTWCDMAHDGPDGNPGWHQGRTVAVTAPTSTFGTPTTREPESTVLAARINQTAQDNDVFGLETQVWLDVDTEVLALNVGQFRALLAQLRRVLPEWEAMANQAERLAADDHPGDPALRSQFMAEVDARIKAHDEGRTSGEAR